MKNVTITGASGSLGEAALQKLLDSKAFNVQVLRRTGSSSAFPPGVTVIDVDFDSVQSLASTLRNQDAVVATLGGSSINSQKKLIDAAIEAGVSRFIPSEYGSDFNVQRIRSLPVFQEKVKISDYLREKASSGAITYTSICNNAFLDWGIQHNFIFDHSHYTPVMINGGSTVFSATTIDSVADAIVGVLLHPNETRNKTVFIEDMKISQQYLLNLAKKLFPNKPWDPKEVELDELIAHSEERLQQGLYDMETFAPYLYRASMEEASGCNFTRTDNDLLSVKRKTEGDLELIMRRYIG